MPSSHASANPCQACGACCASFRVSFYWAEAEARGLPAEFTEQLNPWFSCMAGTNQRAPRCDALAGEVGLKAKMGAAFKLARARKKGDFIKALLAVSSFAYEGTVPAVMQYPRGFIPAAPIGQASDELPVVPIEPDEEEALAA